MNACLAQRQHAVPAVTGHEAWTLCKQVLEDLEALAKLLSLRASDAERTSSTLQKQVTNLQAEVSQADSNHAASNKQSELLKKEAAAAKRVFSLCLYQNFTPQMATCKQKTRHRTDFML